VDEPELKACLACGAADLHAVARLRREGVPHGRWCHRFQFERAMIAACARCGHGQLERFSHDCFQSYDAEGAHESWDLYWWYLLAPDALAQVREVMRPCGRPLVPRCACAAHALLREASGAISGSRRAVSSADGRVPFARVGLVRVSTRWRFELVD
jgi:hypothetical protein